MAALIGDVLGAAGFAVDHATDVLTALRLVDRVDPDAAIIDISLGDGPSGLDLAHVLDQRHRGVALLILTRHPDPRTAGKDVDALPAGAGFLRKDRITDTGYLVQALEAVLSDRAEQVRDDRDPSKPLAALSRQQMEILRLMALGYTNQAIASQKGVTLKSVERWIGEIFKAMGVAKAGDVNPRVEVVRQFVAAAGLPERVD